MADCTYTYHNSDGSISEKYLSDLSKYGEEEARARFISDALKQEAISIKYSIPTDVVKAIKTRISPKELSEKGYIGISSILQHTKNKDTEKNIKALMAVGLKMSEEAKKGKGMSSNEVYEYFGIDKNTMKPSKNEDEFALFERDADSLIEFRKTRGNAIDEFITMALDERLRVPEEDRKNYDKILGRNKYNNDSNAFLSRYMRETKFKENGKLQLSQDTLSALKQIVHDLFINVDKLGKEDGIDDYQLFPQVSIVSDNIKYDNKPMQAHLDILVYSPSKNIGHIIDIKTKSNKAALEFSKVFGRRQGILESVFQSAENDVALQTSFYAIMANQALGIKVMSRKALIIPVNESPDNKDIGQRNWSITAVTIPEKGLESLQNLQVYDGVLQIALTTEKINPIGEKNYEAIVDDLFKGKLVTVSSSKDNFINKFISRAVKLSDGSLQWDHPYDKSIKLIKSTEEELKEEIAKVYDEYILKKKRAAKDLIAIFETGDIAKDSIWNSPIMRNKATKLLARFKKDSHTMESSNSIEGIGDDIIVVTNKSTGVVSLLSIALTYNDHFHFNEDTDETSRTTLYGPFVDDEVVTKRFGVGKIPKATTQSLNQLKLVLLASELKLRDPNKYANIADILSTCLLTDTEDLMYNFADINSMRGHIKTIKELMIENGQQTTGEFEMLVDAQQFSKADAFDVNYFNIFMANIQAAMDPLSDFIRSKPSGPKNKNVIKELRESIDNYIIDKYNLNIYPKLTNAMVKYMEVLYSRLLLEKKSPSEVYNDERYVAANRAFLSFKNMMVAEDPTFRGTVLGQINSLTTAGSRYAEKVHVVVGQYEQQAREKIYNLIEEHVRLQDELMKVTPGVNVLVSIFDPSNFKKVFGPMLEDGYQFDENNVENWMKFKDPSKLSGPQKAYVEFYNKIVNSSFKTLFGENKANLMFPETTLGIKVQKWKDGYIPILPKHASVDLRNISSMRNGMEASLGMIKNLFTRAKKSTMSENSTELNPWEYSSFFPDQLDNTLGRGSKKTREFLNITEDNKVISTKRSIELNPAIILNMLIVEAARKEHMTLASFTAHAMQAELVYRDSFPGIDTKALNSLIENHINLRVHGKVKDEGKFADYVDSLKQMTSTALFFASIRQFFTESITATFQLSAQGIANFYNNVLFKGNNSYNNKDLAWAAKHFKSDLGDQIVDMTGMFTSISEFLSDDFVMTRDKLLIQTKWGFIPIKLVLKQSIQSVVLAQMHKQGMTEKCFIKDKNGIYRYDETKDTNRFYVYDPDLNIDGQQTQEPKTEEEIAKWKLWKAHRLQMAKEGGIDPKTNKMTRPFITEELLSFKNQATRLIGATDNTEALALEFLALGRAVSAYKKWIRQRLANYWTPKSKSFKMGKWKMVDDEMKYVEEDFEGIINTFVGLVKDIKQIGFSAALSGMNDIQKRNMSKLMADLTLFAFIILLLTSLDDLLEETLLGREFHKALINATGDLVPVMALYTTATGSPAASISIAMNTSMNAIRTLGYLVTANTEAALQAADRTADVFGAYRSTKSLFEIMTGFEPQK